MLNGCLIKKKHGRDEIMFFWIKSNAIDGVYDFEIVCNWMSMCDIYIMLMVLMLNGNLDIEPWCWRYCFSFNQGRTLFIQSVLLNWPICDEYFQFANMWWVFPVQRVGHSTSWCILRVDHSANWSFWKLAYWRRCATEKSSWTARALGTFVVDSYMVSNNNWTKCTKAL